MTQLSERQEIDRIEIVDKFKFINVRTATVIMRDGIEISRTFHRHVVSPDSDITNEDPQIQKLAELLHTEKLKKEYEIFCNDDILIKN